MAARAGTFGAAPGVLALVGLLAAGCMAEVPTRELRVWELEVAGKRTVVELPAHLRRGSDPEVQQLVLRTKVAIDEAWRGRDVTLSFPILRAPIHLAVDGRPVVEVDEHFFDRDVPMTPHRFRIGGSDTRRGELTLELTIEVAWVQSSWIDVVPRISLGSFGDRTTRLVRLVNFGGSIVSLVALLTIGLLFYMLHVTAFLRGSFTEADHKNTDFSRLAIGAALFAAAQAGVLQPLLGRSAMLMSFCALLITMRSSIQLLRRYLGRPLLPAWTGWVVFASLFVLPLLTGPYVRMEWAFMMLLGILAMLVSSLFTVWRTPSPRPVEVYWMAFCWVGISAFAAVDLRNPLGLGAPLGGVQITCLGLLLFVCMQAYILSREHTSLLIEQGRLNESLGKQVAEVGSLNEALRRKVIDRSRELAAVLQQTRSSRGATLPAGTVLGEQYTIVRLLGSGAMGEVHRVERISDGRSFAAKLMRGRARPDALERFMREAEVAASIVHPNVVRVFDVDIDAGGEVFLVMELVEGASLDDERAHYGEVEFARAVLHQVASALAAIHAAGVIHRDLKPANVLVSYADGLVIKVADFGIAGFRGERTNPPAIEKPASISGEEQALEATIDAPTTPPSNPRMTATGAIMGTPLYMAPEVLAGAGGVGLSADLFSFGVLAYQVLGGPALERDGFGLNRRALRSFAELAPTLSPALAAALTDCLSPDPTLRPTAARLSELFAHDMKPAAG